MAAGAWVNRIDETFRWKTGVRRVEQAFDRWRYMRLGLNRLQGRAEGNKRK